jgi:hypothetical protein
MPRFCETCGTPLTETARFCANCGTAVVTPPQSSVAEPQPSVVTPTESSVAEPHPTVVTPPESSIAPPSFRNSKWVVVVAVAVVAILVIIVTQFRDDTRSVGRAPNSDGTDMPSQQSSATPSQSSSTPVEKDARQSFLELRESGRLPSWAKLVCFVDHSFLDEVKGDWGPKFTIDTSSGPKLDLGKIDEFWLFSGNLMRVQAWDKGVGENFLLFHKLTAESFYSRGTWNNRSVAIALNLRINNREIAEKDGGYLAPPGGRLMSCESIN